MSNRRSAEDQTGCAVTNDVQWNSVWALYKDFPGVFHRALVELSVQQDQHADMIHEFLLERAPDALRSFDPSRGEIAPWLYVVFRRFALGRLQNDRRRVEVLEELAREPSVADSIDDPLDTERMSNAWRKLPGLEQRALRAYLEHGVQGATRAMGVSPWHVKRIVILALAKLLLDLRLYTGVDPADLALLAHGSGDDRHILWLAHKMGRPSSEARKAVQRARHGLAALFANQGHPEKGQRP
jgi:RNA polymerase sigma factor (sigma-70 family)